MYQTTYIKERMMNSNSISFWLLLTAIVALFVSSYIQNERVTSRMDAIQTQLRPFPRAIAQVDSLMNGHKWIRELTE